MQHKKQHWIPRSYVSAWCDPEHQPLETPFVWLFSKDGASSKRKAPENSFTESDFYTVKGADGSRDLSMEHGLAGLESSFVELRDGPLRERRALDDDERAVLCAFVAAMHGRTRAQRNHLQRQWQEVSDMMENIKRSVERMTPAERERLPSGGSSSSRSFTYDEVRQFADAPMQNMLVPKVAAEMPILLAMHCCVLCTEDPLGFITSDSPVAMFDADAYKRPFPHNTPAFGFEGAELSMPISPNQLALFTWKPLDGYLPLPDAAYVDELNRRTRFYCDEHFVVRKNEVRPLWLDPGQRPADAPLGPRG